MFAALRAVSEAVLRATSPEDLFQRVCDAAVHDGKVGCAGVLLAEPDERLRLVAGAGEGLNRLRALKLPANPGSSEGVGALIPIMRGGSRIGVFAFCPDRSGPFSDPVVELLKHVVEKVSSALDHFDQERERERLVEANDLLDRRFRLLNATNKAILRARSVSEMFRMVCEATTGPGRLLGASVSLHDPNSPWFARAACSGALGDIYETVRISADPNLREGQGVAANVFRTGEPCFIDDLANDPRAAPWRSRLLAGGVRAGAVLPLMKSGQVVGVCSFFLGNDSGPLDDARIQLTTRVAETISFGMELFERQEQKDNVTRMFIALSATNEAIMRAQTRA